MAVLQRNLHENMIAGVCAGLADYFHTDPTLLRLIFVLLTVFGGGGILLYIILWIIMPIKGQLAAEKSSRTGAVVLGSIIILIGAISIIGALFEITISLFGVAFIVIGIILLATLARPRGE